jgi:hypothetical protein
MNNTTQATDNTQVFVIWTDPKTNETYQAEVPFDTRLDFDKMNNVVLSM